MSVNQFPSLGFGLGLRPQHYQDILDTKPAVDWFEILSENYLVPGGRPLYFLEQICDRYPVVMHGVSMSIGSSDPLNFNYLRELKHLIELAKPKWVSDHLCWTGVDKINLHDLMPLPYTPEAIQHVVDRVNQVQDYLGRPLVLENVSSYITYTQSQMPEWEFFTAIAEKADCYLLLDVNNIYVSAFNHGFDPETYIDYVPVNRVVQFHIAGHTNLKTHIIDTHDSTIIPAVWKLYSRAVARFPHASTLLERDDHIPPLAELVEELNHARVLAHTALNTRELEPC